MKINLLSLSLSLLTPFIYLNPVSASTWKVTVQEDQSIKAPIPERNAEAYSEGRLPYPTIIFESIKQIIGENATVLDAGCGNGRATIPLRQFCTKNIIGYDFDEGMLKEAVKNSKAEGLDIPFFVGSVKDLLKQFPGQRFKAVTAFTAFSHFDDPESIEAIRSVLEPEGVFIVGGSGSSEIGKFMRQMAKTLDIIIPPGHDGREHNNTLSLVQNGFEIIQELIFSVEETFTCQQVLANFKSRLTWARLTKEQQDKIIQVTQDYFQTELKSDRLTLPGTSKITVYKPKA